MATLINGNGNLAIYAQQDADWYAALMGGQTVITAVGNQFAYELLDANTIGVKDGVIITTEGRRIQLDANAIDSFDIPTGAQGTTNYYIIGYHLVTGDLSEQTCETFVQLMENGTDTIPEGSFRDGDDEVFVSLYRVEQNDLTLGTITLLLPQLSGSFQSQITELNNDLSDFKFRNNNGVPEFSMDNGTTWQKIGGGGMRFVDVANKTNLMGLSGVNTLAKDSLLYVNVLSNRPGNIKVDGVSIFSATNVTTAAMVNNFEIPLKAGQTIESTFTSSADKGDTAWFAPYFDLI